MRQLTLRSSTRQLILVAIACTIAVVSGGVFGLSAGRRLIAQGSAVHRR